MDQTLVTLAFLYQDSQVLRLELLSRVGTPFSFWVAGGASGLISLSLIPLYLAVWALSSVAGGVGILLFLRLEDAMIFPNADLKVMSGVLAMLVRFDSCDGVDGSFCGVKITSLLRLLFMLFLLWSSSTLLFLSLAMHPSRFVHLLTFVLIALLFRQWMRLGGRVRQLEHWSLSPKLTDRHGGSST